MWVQTRLCVGFHRHVSGKKECFFLKPRLNWAVDYTRDCPADDFQCVILSLLCVSLLPSAYFWQIKSGR